MIFIQPLRSNDVNPSQGKQYEFGKAFVNCFGWLPNTDHVVLFHYKKQSIKTLVRVRGGNREGVDAKEYVTDGRLQFKDFLIQELGLNDSYIGKVELIFEPIDSTGSEFNLYVSPEAILRQNRYVPSNVVISSRSIKDFAINVFQYLDGTKELEKLGVLTETKTYSNGAKRIQLSAGNSAISGLFLKDATIESLDEDLRPSDWYDRPFIIDNTSYLLSNEWYPSGKNPSLDNLSKILGYSFSGKYAITCIDGCYYLTLSNNCLQKILYGAPGAGKSYKIRESYLKDSKNVFRTTFHPDYDYSTFVGCYKPCVEKERNNKCISYSFVPQIFIDAYVKAWQCPSEPVYLVIEEINRGNCAQIFGDLFQLLDRNNGLSEYGVIPDKDLQLYLSEVFGKSEDSDGNIYDSSKINEYPSIKNGSEMKIPANLNILATMNTSDQSLFPMDSAFKRRWDWEYVPIDYKDAEQFTIITPSGNVNWGDFIKNVNKRIFNVTDSPDKQIGNRFVKLDGTTKEITEDQFVNKVLYYLWTDVFKDRQDEKDNIFISNDDKKFSFESIFQDVTDGSKYNQGKIQAIFENLGLLNNNIDQQ